MKMPHFAQVVASCEGKKKSLSIAQIKEVLKIVNILLGGLLYKLIDEMSDKNIMSRSWKA